MNRKKRILFLMINLPIGGAEWVVTNLCNEFVNKGIRVTLVSVKGGELLDKLDKRVTIKSYDGNYRKAFWYTYKKLLFRRVDSVFSTQRFCAFFLSTLHLFSFSNAILNIREAASNFGHSLQRYYWFRKPLFTFGYRRADNIIANSEGTLKSLKENGIINSKQNTVIISNPLDITEVQQKSEYPIEGQFDFNKFTIISIGRLVKNKNMDVIIRSLLLVREKISDAQLIILGDGPERKNLENLIKELGLDNSVHLGGFKENPYPYLKSSDVFVLASEWEGFGMVIVEALALGVPVIATDIDSGPKVILENGRYGKLVKPGDVKSLSRVIVSLQSTEKHIKGSFVKRAMEYDKSIIAEKYLEVIFKTD